MKMLKSDMKLTFAIGIFVLISLIGVFSNQLACDTCLIPYSPNDVFPETKIYSPPGTVDIVEGSGSIKIGDKIAEYLDLSMTNLDSGLTIGTTNLDDLIQKR